MEIMSMSLPLPWSLLSWSPGCWWSSWSPSTACSGAWWRLVGNAPQESARRCPPPPSSCTGPPSAWDAPVPGQAPPPSTSWSSKRNKSVRGRRVLCPVHQQGWWFRVTHYLVWSCHLSSFKQCSGSLIFLWEQRLYSVMEKTDYSELVLLHH